MSEFFRKYIKKEHYPVQPSSIRFKTSFKNCILESLKRRTWKETDHESEWEIFWTEKEWIHEVMDHLHLMPNQRVNHFRNYYELCRKDNLIKNLKRYKKSLEKEGKLDEAAAYNFFPTTYNLPGEYSIFCEEFKRNSNHVWIMKPIGKSQGKGIFLFNKLSQVSQWKSETRWKPDAPQVENYIVQRYINNPLLIGGKKFDMRIYCLVTSYSPLVAYLYRDGFARFTHHRYDNDDISNAFVHLTNVAIQKTSENYDEKLGGKWDLRTLKLYLMSKYGQDAVGECFSNIQQVIIRSLQSVQKVMINDKHCFELYGFDILLDDQLKPWLIEVNGSPSMTANTPHDFELKCNLLDDVFTIIDMEKILVGQEEQIGGFDLICKGIPTRTDTSLFASMLGSFNNRSQNLKKLAKIIASKLSQAFLIEKEEAKKILNSREGTGSDTYSVNGIRAKGKAGQKVTTTTIGVAKTTKPNMLTKQNTLTIQKEGRESKDPKDSQNLVKQIKPPRLSDIGKAKTFGLPPVNNINNNGISNNSTNVSGPTSAFSTNNNTTPLSNSGVYLQKTTSFSTHVNVSSLQTNSQQLGKLASQPSQGQSEKGSTIGSKLPSTLQLAGGASLKLDMGQSLEFLKNKGKSIGNMQDLLDSRQYAYNYDSNLPSSKLDDKTERYTFVKGSHDLNEAMTHKETADKRKVVNHASEYDRIFTEEEAKRKEYYNATNEGSISNEYE